MKLPLSLISEETKAMGDSEICFEGLWEESSHMGSCSFAWFSLSSSLQFCIQAAIYRGIYPVSGTMLGAVIGESKIKSNQ